MKKKFNILHPSSVQKLLRVASSTDAYTSQVQGCYKCILYASFFRLSASYALQPPILPLQPSSRPLNDDFVLTSRYHREIQDYMSFIACTCSNVCAHSFCFSARYSWFSTSHRSSYDNNCYQQHHNHHHQFTTTSYNNNNALGRVDAWLMHKIIHKNDVKKQNKMVFPVRAPELKEHRVHVKNSHV